MSDKQISVVLVVQESGSFPVQPKDIKADGDWPLGGAFGKTEMEQTSAAIVRLCQARSGWTSFTREELKKFLPDMDRQNDDGLDDLVYHHWLMKTALKRYVVTGYRFKTVTYILEKR